jgi:hypothetical protein
MYRRTIGFAIALMIAAVFCSMGLNGCKKSAQAAEAAKPAPEAPEGYVLVEEDILNAFADLPGEHFHKARQSFLQKDYKTAAEEIRKGIAFLRLQAARATTEGKKGLIDSIAELEKLAGDVEKGTVTSAKTLNHAFAKAHYALARHHYLKAMEYKAKGAGSKLGHALKASAIHLEHGFAWAGHMLEAATVAVLKDTGLVAGKLIEGTGWIGKEAGDIIDKIGVEIEKLGKMLEPAKKSRPQAPAPATAPATEPSKTK